MKSNNEAVLREALEEIETMCKGTAAAVVARAALAATATVAKDGGEPIDYAGDFVKLAIDEAEKRGLDYVSTRILRALLAKYATPKPDTSARDAALEEAAALFPQPFMEYDGAFIQDAIRALKTLPGEPT